MELQEPQLYTGSDVRNGDIMDIYALIDEF